MVGISPPKSLTITLRDRDPANRLQAVLALQWVGVIAALEAEVALAIRESDVDRRKEALDMSWFIFLVPYREPEE